MNIKYLHQPDFVLVKIGWKASVLPVADEARALLEGRRAVRHRRSFVHARWFVFYDPLPFHTQLNDSLAFFLHRVSTIKTATWPDAEGRVTRVGQCRARGCPRAASDEGACYYQI